MPQLFSSTNEFKSFIEKFLNNFIPQIDSDLPDLYSKMKFDLDLYLPDSLLSFLDQVTMANTIEGRVPYLDKELVTSSFGINHKYHLFNDDNRRIQKSISKNRIISQTFIQKKQGFSGPVKNWINLNLDKFLSTIIDSDVHNVNKTYIEKMSSNLKSENNYYYNIFSLYCYTVWYNNNITR